MTVLAATAPTASAATGAFDSLLACPKANVTAVDDTQAAEHAGDDHAALGADRAGDESGEAEPAEEEHERP